MNIVITILKLIRFHYSTIKFLNYKNIVKLYIWKLIFEVGAKHTNFALFERFLVFT